MRYLVPSFLLLCAVVRAQEQQRPPEEKASQEPKVVRIYATDPTRGEELFNSAQDAYVLDRRGIQNERLSRTLPEALKETPGAHVQKTGPGQGSPVLRGMTGYHTLLLIDGIRLNNSTFRSGPNQYWGTVDSFLIDRMDVVMGPSSVLYGSDALGGTAYVHTIGPPGFEAGFHPRSRSVVRYSSAERSYTGRQEFFGNVDDFGWTLGGTYRDFNDVDGGRHVGEMEGTGYDEYNADAKLVYRVDKNSRLVLAYQRHRLDDAARWHSTANNPGWHGAGPGTDLRRDFDQERDLAYVQYHAETEGGLVDSFKISVSAHRQAETGHRTQSSGAKEFRQFDVLTPGVWLQAGKQTDFGYFTAGAEYYRDDVDSKGHNRTSAGVLVPLTRGEVADEATYDLWGVYLQDEISFGPLDVTAGLRYTAASVEADEVDPTPGGSVIVDSIDDDYSGVTGSLRFLYHVNENWNAIAGWGMGFRAPSLDDSTAIKLVLSGEIDLPAEDLDPETSHTFDLGVRARYDTFELSAFAFYTLLRDFIGRVEATTDFDGDGLPDNTKDNLSEGWIYGFEVTALYRLTPELGFFGTWGYAKGEAEILVGTTEEDRPLGKMSPSTLQLGARYVPKDSRVWVEGLVRVVRHQHHLSPPEASGDTQRIPPGGTPGFTTYNLRGGYDINENVTASLAIENISNKDYRPHGSGQNEPGTNVILGLEVKF